MYLRVIASLVAVLACIAVAAGHEDKVSVTVYYESLCPDSKKFFMQQLYPTLRTNVSHWVNLTLVPYGKSTKKPVDDKWEFTCDHGSFECFGNKLHACALREIEELVPTPAGAGFNNITVALINCLMDKVENKSVPGTEPKYDFHLTECATMHHVPNYVKIENCQNHPDGSKFLAEMGDLTDKFQSPLKSVPSITFNGNDDTAKATKNFVEVLCSYIKGDKPAECKNSASSLSLSVLLVAVVLFKHLF